MIVYKKLWLSIRKRIFLLLGKCFHVKAVKGLSYLLDMKNQVDRKVDAFAEYEKPQLIYFFSILKQSKCNCFVDIGSHWGYYSLLFANETCFSEAEIHAFEPDRINRYQLYANLFLNKLQDRINVYEYAISSTEGELRFHRFDDNNRGRSCIAENGEVVVKTARLDTLLNTENKIIGIKIDVEGHELDVISGMQETLKNNICILQIESFTDVFAALKKSMSEMGYVKMATIGSDHYFINDSLSADAMNDNVVSLRETKESFSGL
jgi:FkbM family methyltransferase